MIEENVADDRWWILRVRAAATRSAANESGGSERALAATTRSSEPLRRPTALLGPSTLSSGPFDRARPEPRRPSQVAALGAARHQLIAPAAPARLAVGTRRALRPSSGAATSTAATSTAASSGAATSGAATSGLRIAGGADVAEQRAQLAAEALTAAPLPTGRAGHAPRRAPPLVHAALRQPGRPLDEPLGELFGAALGHDLGDVEVHDGELASRSAEAIGARAYSVGHHVVLGAPSSRVTRLQLLAHELAHVSERAEVVHCYESGEHAQAGDAARKVTINGITLDEGDLVALGDFYEKPEDIYKAPAAELSQLVTFIERDKKYYAGQGGTPVSNAEWAAVTKNRPADQQYLELAKRNDPHFAPHASGRPGEKGDHKAQWREYHRQAILAVIAAAAAGKTGVPRRRLCSTALPRTSSPTPSPPGTSSTRTT